MSLESRAATPGLGKCTDEIKTTVPEEVKEDFNAIAITQGYRPADYLRVIVLEHVYGQLHTTRLLSSRRNGNGEHSPS